MREIGGIRTPTTRVPRWVSRRLWRPMGVDELQRGRLEICVGRPGSGKTTFGVLRARQLAVETGRELLTNSLSPIDGFQFFGDWREFDRARDCVMLLDEVHLLAPSVVLPGAVTKADVLLFANFLTDVRKRGVCVVGTTQSWGRITTLLRDTATMVWPCEPLQRGRLHRAFPLDPPADGGQLVASPHLYNPAWAGIDTLAASWRPSVTTDE